MTTSEKFFQVNLWRELHNIHYSLETLLLGIAQSTESSVTFFGYNAVYSFLPHTGTHLIHTLFSP